MRFIQHNSAQCLAEKHCILWTTEHIFEHRIVSNDNIRNRSTWGGRKIDCFPIMRFQPTCLPPCPHPANIPFGDAFFICTRTIFRRFARKMKESHDALSLQPFIEAIHLVIDKGIHRVENNAFDAIFTTFTVIKEIVENWQKKAFRLSGSGACCDDKSRFGPIGICGLCFKDWVTLVKIELTLFGYHPAFIEMVAEFSIEACLLDQIFYRFGGSLCWKRALNP